MRIYDLLFSGSDSTARCYFSSSVKRSTAISVGFSPEQEIVMLRRTKVAVSFVLVAFSLMTGGASDANADSKLPDPIKAGVAEKLFSSGLWSLPCKRRVGMDAGRKRRTEHRILVYLLAHKAWKRVAALGCRSSRGRAQRPPRLVYLTQIDRLPPRQDADRSTR